MPIDEKPSRNEDEYAVRLDAQLLRERRAALDLEREKRERNQHYMKCPKCGCDLHEREYHHVKVDVCSECKGMWLDKGEVQLIQHTERNWLGRVIGDIIGISHSSSK